MKESKMLQSVSNDIKTEDVAMTIAIAAHDGQYNKFTGDPYILHPMRVARSLSYTYWSGTHIALGWLHDVVEDTDVDMDYIGKVFWNNIRLVDALELLTKKKGQSIEEYYEAILGNELARVVKIHDMWDNLSRLDVVTDPFTRERLRSKYQYGFYILDKDGEIV